MVSDPGAEAGIAGEEFIHSIAIARQDHHQILALGFHHLQQDLDRLLAVVALVVGSMQVIGLVDEKHAAHCLFQDLLGLGRGVANILPDQLIAGDGDNLATTHEAEFVENACDP